MVDLLSINDPIVPNSLPSTLSLPLVTLMSAIETSYEPYLFFFVDSANLLLLMCFNIVMFLSKSFLDFS